MADFVIRYGPTWLSRMIMRRRAQDAHRKLVKFLGLLERWIEQQQSGDV